MSTIDYTTPPDDDDQSLEEALQDLIARGEIEECLLDSGEVGYRLTAQGMETASKLVGSEPTEILQ